MERGGDVLIAFEWFQNRHEDVPIRFGALIDSPNGLPRKIPGSAAGKDRAPVSPME